MNNKSDASTIRSHLRNAEVAARLINSVDLNERMERLQSSFSAGPIQTHYVVDLEEVIQTLQSTVDAAPITAQSAESSTRAVEAAKTAIGHLEQARQCLGDST